MARMRGRKDEDVAVELPRETTLSSFVGPVTTADTDILALYFFYSQV